LSSFAKQLKPPELFFGIAAAVGTNAGAVEEALQAALLGVNYTAQTIGVSALLDMVDWTTISDAPDINDRTYDTHVSTRMNAGNALREATGQADAMALLALFVWAPGEYWAICAG
jgi:hypothetical protein